MLKLNTTLEGKTALFGEAKHLLKKIGYDFGGNWDYHCGSFDSVLYRQEGETFYLRVPFCVIDGMLDHHHAHIEFETPYIIKHVVNVGLDTDESSLVSAAFNQFQEPIDRDGAINNEQKWEEIGEQAIRQIMNTLYRN